MSNSFTSSRFASYMPHIIVWLLALSLIFVYFSPVFSGKKLVQSDLVQVSGMGQEVFDYKEKTGETSLWTNSMFGGMPVYHISGIESSFNLFSMIAKAISFGLPQPLPLVILYFLGAYILLISFGTGPWIAGIGAIGFAFSSYNFIILEAGHYNKSLAIAFMGPVLAGMRYTYRKDLVIGGILTAFFVALQVWGGHPQITYYLLFAILVYILTEAWYAYTHKTLPYFFKASFVLLLAAGLGTATYAGHLYINYDYAKHTIRGEAELSTSGNETRDGLDKDYAFAWSYGKMETFTLLIPRFMGGSSREDVGKDSKTYKALKQNGYPDEQARSLPTYWGAQPFTSGPVYAGAIILFLFVLGCFLTDVQTRTWILAATLLSFMLAWGKNLEWFSDALFNTLPMFNKFRAVAMALVVASITIPLMAGLGLKAWMDGNIPLAQKKKALTYTLAISGGLSLLFAIIGGMLFDFKGVSDERLGQLAEMLMDDRRRMLQLDAFRSFVFIAMAAGVLYLFLVQKVKPQILLLLTGVLVTVDLWTINLRYISKEDFESSRKMETPFTPSNADRMIMEDKDPNFRVLNTTLDPFNDASTSYFHKSVGGYHPAKLRRYQDMIERHISKNHFNVLNMLNTKYFIMSGQDEQPMARLNPGAMGNAWFVSEVKWVSNADAEIEALNPPFDPAKVAVIDERFKPQIQLPLLPADSLDQIRLVSYKPNEIIYESVTSADRLAVFSEIYFSNGWKVWIDDTASDHVRANYILRAMQIPEGKHTIKFRFDPDDYTRGNTVGDIASGIVTVLLVLAFVMMLRRKEEK